MDAVRNMCPGPRAWRGELVREVIARTFSRRVIQNDELAGSLEGRGRDERLAKEDAYIRDEVARGGMVGAIEHIVII